MERWVRLGLINADQRDAILQDLARQRPAEAGLTFTTLLYYSGGLLVLIAYSIFLGLQWEALNQGGRIAIAAPSLVFFAGVSTALLRFERFRLPGELLQVVAVAVVPLLAFALIDAAGLLPEDPGAAPFSRQQEEYTMDLTWVRMALAGVALLAALVAFGWSRSPFVLTAAAISLASLAVDASIAAQRARSTYLWETPQAMVIAALGTASFAAGAALRDRTERDYSIWLYLLGLAGLAAGLGAKAFPEEAATGWGVLWMIASLIVLGLSVPLQQRIVAAAGLAAVLAYLARTVFVVFESTNAALVLVLLGVVVLGIGLLYQRYGERLFARLERG